MRSIVLPLCGGLALVPVLATTPLAAQRPEQTHYADVSVALRAGTTGFSLELGKLLTSHLAVRVGANYLKVTATKDQSDITYDATLKMQSFSALLDLFPGRRGGFHLTGGIVTNPITITGTAQPTGGTYTINGVDYTSAQVGVLIAEAKLPSASPYVGIGFGTPARNHALEIVFDIGAVIGQPTITMSATGAAADPQLTGDLQAQVTQTQSDVRKYLKVWPVMSLGLAFRF
jgi:hypothetical protein